MRKLTLLLFALTLTACATAPQTTTEQCRLSDATINATSWMQTSAEYQAITREVYGTAARTLDDAIADKSWTAAIEQTGDASSLPPAIILDLDETTIDTSSHQTGLIRSNTGYSDAEWHEWAMHDPSRVIEVARDFLDVAQKRGVSIFFVTNRLKTEEDALRATLTRLNLPLSDDNVLTRNEREEWKASDKTPRRAFVASHYRVIMLFGDDLNDFAAAAGKSLADRDAIVRAHTNDWGRKWFVLPNPVYGSWERTVVGDAKGCDQLKRKIEALK